ncbi:MAG: hypothetical protein DIU71_03090 [Proteobacteria bacterium]|nr:MAG: hypothetical protein DIU71_03090 [Pseudomonadota bacterium]
MKYRAILFDFDGTLVPSLPLWAKAFQAALRGHGVALTEEEVIRACFFRDWAAVAADHGIASADELRLAVERGLREAFLDATLFPLARAVIDHCRAHGLQTALVTSAPRSMIDEVIPRLALEDAFDFRICADDVANHKPHPEPVLTALAALERQPHEAIMIGDSRADILAGKAAGTATALFLPEEHSRFHCFDTLRACGPDHVFVDHAELPALFGLPQLGLRQAVDL